MTDLVVVRRPIVVVGLRIARGEVGVREAGRNRGQRVEMYQASVGLPPGEPYCAAFAYWVYDEAARELGIRNPCPRAWSAGKLWLHAPPWMRRKDPVPGAIGIHLINPANPYSHGHAIIVVDVVGNAVPGDSGPPELITVEANTNEAGSNEGDGVREKTRPLDYVNVGYIDVGATPPVA